MDDKIYINGKEYIPPDQREFDGYGIRNVLEAIGNGYDIARCSYCWTYYYDSIDDPRHNNSLKILWDEENEEFFKGCPICETDDYLGDYHIADDDELEKNGFLFRGKKRN